MLVSNTELGVSVGACRPPGQGRTKPKPGRTGV